MEEVKSHVAEHEQLVDESDKFTLSQATLYGCLLYTSDAADE